MQDSSWLDPREVTSEKDFFYQYVVAWGFAQAVREILLLVEEMTTKVKHLEKKKRGEVDNSFKIGE